MRRRWTAGRVGFICALSLVIAAVRPATAQAQQAQGEKPAGRERPERNEKHSSVVKASEELLDLERKTRQIEKETTDRRKASQSRLRDLESDKAATERVLETLRRRVQDREKESSAKREMLAAREAELARLQHDLSLLSEPLKQFLDRVEKLVEGGISWKNEPRKAAVQAARQSLSAQGAAPAAGLAAVGRVQEEEEALGRLVESAATEVEVRGEYRAVQAFHLGHLAVIYASADGTILGCALPGQKLEEGLLGAGKKDVAAEYLAALEVLRRRRMPRVLDLYFPTLPRESEETK